MFDIGWSEFFIIGILVLLVIGPREIPKLLYEIGKWIRYARSFTREFHTHIDHIVHEVEIQEIKKEVDQIREKNLNQVLENTIDPDKSLRSSLSLTDDLQQTADKTSTPVRAKETLSNPTQTFQQDTLEDLWPTDPDPQEVPQKANQDEQKDSRPCSHVQQNSPLSGSSSRTSEE